MQLETCTHAHKSRLSISDNLYSMDPCPLTGPGHVWCVFTCALCSLNEVKRQRELERVAKENKVSDHTLCRTHHLTLCCKSMAMGYWNWALLTVNCIHIQWLYHVSYTCCACSWSKKYVLPPLWNLKRSCSQVHESGCNDDDGQQKSALLQGVTAVAKNSRKACLVVDAKPSSRLAAKAQRTFHKTQRLTLNKSRSNHKLT